MTENKKEKTAAIALEYDGENTPFVSATGLDSIAEQIIELAIEHEIPLYENAELAEQLAEINLGNEIPERLFLAIAHIIAFAYHLQGKVPGGWSDGSDTSNDNDNSGDGKGLVVSSGRLYDGE